MRSAPLFYLFAVLNSMYKTQCVELAGETTSFWAALSATLNFTIVRCATTHLPLDALAHGRLRGIAQLVDPGLKHAQHHLRPGPSPAAHGLPALE